MALPPELDRQIDVLLIDNFDSFTWNLYQSLSLLGADVTVVRNDAIAKDQLPALKIKFLIISPGPGHPATDSGISRDAIHYFTGKVPVLGVCMGLQCLVDVFGGKISSVGEIKHGKVSHIRHDGRGCFTGIPQGIKSTRYHSLGAGMATLPPVLAVTATTQESGIIMGVRHRLYTLEAVQYHPESILSESGDTLVKNFLSLRGGKWQENPTFHVLDRDLPPFSVDPVDGAAKPADKVPTILERIYAQRMKDVELAKKTPGTTPEDLGTFLAMNLAPPSVSFLSRLRDAARKPALMAEIKRASPSKGPIAMAANSAEQALTYALAGASVISVLTEPTWFKGTLLDMRLARQAIDTLSYRPAVLRKDFIFDEYQIAEARLHGADSVLLIVAMLPTPRLTALYAYAQSLGIEPLVEVNNASEMERAIELGARVIGVNNRNLHSFEVDMNTTSRLADMVRERDIVLCALSGIKDAHDVKAYQDQGVGAVLVGEALMRAADTSKFIRQLLDWPEPAHELIAIDKAPPPLVKICGIQSVVEALGAMDAGADMLGLMFVPTSKRYVSLAQAQKISAAIHAARLSRPAPNTSRNATVNDQTNRPWFAANAARLGSVLSSPDSPARPLLVGVFQNQPLTEIVAAIAYAGLDMVQLHGSEPPEFARHIPVPTIRVFHVDVQGRDLAGLTTPGLSEFVLLDAVKAGSTDGLSGGSGQSVDWTIARDVVRKGEVSGPIVQQGGEDGNVEVHKTMPIGFMPIILAGGLTPENVREAVEVIKPWAVDVSSGVEVDGGRGKDLTKVRAFVLAAKGL
ncbi:N-anthranilate isomerase [Sparassis latifolia]|uniref:Multifunctional tryptophan biosynthesis protein n=1 Tax=Sparassis crispa TaxID=139825 RepID=A0A401GFH1_9APHY|nr:Multifunctional tryptophan biosynthesis protein [Sparassis crispa]GBE80944.1 Multifunctional tryptophan biosynthesis protein [Sparassis crispa]